MSPVSMLQHILNKYPIPLSGVLHQHIGHGTDELSVLDNGAPLMMRLPKHHFYHFPRTWTVQDGFDKCADEHRQQ